MRNVPFARLGHHALSAAVGLLAIIVTLLSCTPSITVLSPINESRSAFLDSLAESTVILLNDSTCAGVWVGKHEILTASHCVDTPVWCTTNDGTSIEKCSDAAPGSTGVFFFKTHDDIISGGNIMAGRSAAVLTKLSRRADLALLQTKLPAPRIAALTDDEPEPGSTVHVVGHPHAVPYMRATVHVKRNTWERVHQNKIRYERRLTVVDYMAAGGTSGGGIWNERGELVGICLSRSIWKIINESYFASIEEVKTLMGIRGPMSPH